MKIRHTAPGYAGPAAEEMSPADVALISDDDGVAKKFQATCGRKKNLKKLKKMDGMMPTGLTHMHNFARSSLQMRCNSN